MASAEKVVFSCYNCGAPNDHISKFCPKEQQFTRCSDCGNVARNAAGHKITCKQFRFKSKPIGTSYELPLMEFHQCRFTFHNIDQIYCAQSTQSGMQNFLITKFFSIGTNIRLRRIYGSQNIILDMKYKPATTLSIGRIGSSKLMASLLIAENQIRVNHYQHIDNDGIVSFSFQPSAHHSNIHIR